MPSPNYDRPPMGDAAPKPSKLDRLLAKRKTKRHEESHETKVDKIVDKRDKGMCRCCGRHGRIDSVDPLFGLHRAHIVDRSLGGVYETFNIVTLCNLCHLSRGVHGKQVFILGMNADEPLQFEILEAAVVHIFGTKELPPHVHIVLPDGEKTL